MGEPKLYSACKEKPVLSIFSIFSTPSLPLSPSGVGSSPPVVGLALRGELGLSVRRWDASGTWHPPCAKGARGLHGKCVRGGQGDHSAVGCDRLVPLLSGMSSTWRHQWRGWCGRARGGQRDGFATCEPPGGCLPSCTAWRRPGVRGPGRVCLRDTSSAPPVPCRTARRPNWPRVARA